MSEFEIIQRYFSRPTKTAVLGVGDDCALVRPSPRMEIALSTDTLVAGVHFFSDTDPFKLGYKTLAVNLSDIAAMGAKPRWILLALTLPRVDEHWLEQFSSGLFKLAQRYNVELIGGDTTRGPLNIGMMVIGEVPRGQALRRQGAKLGDEIWISGYLGQAALGLAHLRREIQLPEAALVDCLAALQQPSPRIELGLKLRKLATSAIDISDGLLADLGHILERSRLSAMVEYDKIPRSHALQNCSDKQLVDRCLLSGGDDYELCFTVPSSRHREVEKIAKTLKLTLSCIGMVEKGKQTAIRLLDKQGNILSHSRKGFDHFE